MIDLTPMLAPERDALLEFLRGLSPADWARPTECPAWNVKGLTLHVLGDDLSLLSRQRDAATNGLMLFAEDHPGQSFRELLDGFNEQWVHASTFLGTQALLDLLALVGSWSEAFYSAVDLEELSGEPVGFFAAEGLSPYWQVIAREYVERFVHQSQLRRAVGAPELEGRIVTAAALVVVHAIALWLRDYEATEGSTIAIEFGRSDSWTWKREAAGWSVAEGVEPEPTARVVIAPEHAVAALSRGVSPDDLAAAASIEGDHALAAGAMAIIAPLVARPVE